MNDQQMIRDRIAQLLQLCGEDPSTALARRHAVLPLLRNELGWAAIRPDGALVFIDDDTGRISPMADPAIRECAMALLNERYPELRPFVL